MELNKVGKFIKKLRKEQNLTQQGLADLLGVSPKTISKWETGMGLPDVSLLKKVSEVFNITIEELLDGSPNREEKVDEKVKTKIIFILPLIFITVLLPIIVVICNRNMEAEDINNCTVIRTYYIDNVGRSNDENYLYITVHEYQVEGTYTLKLPKLLSNNLEVGNNYEFTFETSKSYLMATTEELFENSEVINLKYTDKVGNEQINTYYCN